MLNFSLRERKSESQQNAQEAENEEKREKNIVGVVVEGAAQY